MFGRLIPFRVLDWPGCEIIPAILFAALGFLAAAAPALADAGTDERPREPLYNPTRPANTGEFLSRCKQDSLYCEEQFVSYIQRYLAVRVEEFARLPEYRKMRENLRDKQAFDGICLPGDKLLSDDLPVEMSRKFRAWGDKNKQLHAERPPVGVKAAMQAIYPCP